MSPRCLCEDTPSAGAWTLLSACQIKVRVDRRVSSTPCSRRLRGVWCTNHTQRWENCYFKGKLFLSLFGHILDSWVNLPSVTYPSELMWCFMWVFTVETSGLLVFDLAGAFLGAGCLLTVLRIKSFTHVCISVFYVVHVTCSPYYTHVLFVVLKWKWKAHWLYLKWNVLYK